MMLSQNTWLPVLRTLGTKQWFGGRLLVSWAQNAFDDEDMMVDEAAKNRLAQFLKAFVHFIGM